MDELFLATCVGCEMAFLAGTGDYDDPALDVTFDPYLNLFVCGNCYSACESISPENKKRSPRLKTSRN